MNEVKRDLSIEQKAIGTFGQKWGRLPDLNNPKERADVYKMAYPGGLPKELQGTIDESLLAGGQTPATTSPASLEGLKTAKDEAYAGVEQMSQPNEAMRILQQAIKAKTGAKQASIGESEIFKQAGVSGMGALSASLNARNDEMTINQSEFSNIIGKMAGNYSDMANMALSKYNEKKEEYLLEKEKLEAIDKEARDYETQIKLLNKKAEIDKELAGIPSFSEQLAAAEAGYTVEGGQIKKTDGTTDPITGAATDQSKVVKVGNQAYNFTSYATDPNWGNAINNILTSMPEFTSNQEVNNYIQSQAPGSKLRAEDIEAVALETGISPELLLTIAQHESQFMTAGVGARTNNPGNVGNVDSGGTQTFATPKDGLRAIANNALRREVDLTQQGGGINEVDRGTLTMQLGKMIYGTRISDAEGKRISDTIDGYLNSNPKATVADVRQELMKKFLGFDLKKNQDIGEMMLNSIIQFSEEGLADFDMVGLAKLLNEDKILEAMTKIENSAMMQAKKIDPDGYLGEGAAKTTLSLVDKLNSYIKSLGESPIGVVSGTMQNWLGRFKGKEATKIKADIVAIVSDWRKQYAGVNVTQTELEFVNAIAPALYDNPDNFMTKLNSLINQILTKNNSTRTLVGLPEINQQQLLDKKQRVNLYSQNNQSNFNVGSSGQTSSGLKFIIE